MVGGLCPEVHVRIDAYNVYETFGKVLADRRTGGSFKYPDYGLGRWRRILEDIGKLGRGKVVPHWISSHGKRQGWGPPNVGMGNKWSWRSPNDMVDREAKADTKSQALRYGLEEHMHMRM